MRNLSWLLVALMVAVCARGLAQEAQELSAALDDTKNELSISVAGQVFTVYKFSEEQKYPYFFPVNGPVSGKSVTTETSEPYPHHHSLFFGCDKVNGGNYWQDANKHGQIISEGPKLLEAAGKRVVFTDSCVWQQPKQLPIIRDLRTVIVSAPSPSVRYIDFQIQVEPLVGIEIENTNHSLFSARMTPELAVAAGGTLVNAEGLKNEQGTFGVASPWCDYFGTRDGKTEGLALLQYPANRWFPAKWFTRDYGFFSPTPMYWLEGGKLKLEMGQSLLLKYRVVVHAGTTEEAGIAGIFAGLSADAGK